MPDSARVEPELRCPDHHPQGVPAQPPAAPATAYILTHSAAPNCLHVGLIRDEYGLRVKRPQDAALATAPADAGVRLSPARR